MFTFFMLLYAVVILCNVLQSSIRAIVASVFLYRFLLTLEKPQMAQVTFLIYLIVVLGFNLFLSIDIFTPNSGEDCTTDTDWQIIALIALDTLQSLLLIAVTFSMYSKM